MKYMHENLSYSEAGQTISVAPDGWGLLRKEPPAVYPLWISARPVSCAPVLDFVVEVSRSPQTILLLVLTANTLVLIDC